MARLQLGVVRYASIATAIEHAIGVEPPPDCRFVRGRIRLTFRSHGAARWPEAEQIEYALRVAAIARSVLSADSRRAVRALVTRAIVVVCEDAKLLRGCTVTARWECVVLGAPSPNNVVRPIIKS
jgi:hypothetical protein